MTEIEEIKEPDFNRYANMFFKRLEKIADRDKAIEFIRAVLEAAYWQGRGDQGIRMLTKLAENLED